MVHERYKRPNYLFITIEENKGWFFSFNSLCQIDFNTNRVVIEKYLYDENKSKYFPYRNFAKIGDLFYLYPNIDYNFIDIYDSKTKRMQSVELKNLDCNTNMTQNFFPKFGFHAVIDNRIYFVGYSYPAIVVYDLCTKEIVYLNKSLKEIDEHITEYRWTGYFGDGYAISEGYIFFPVAGMAAILKVNATTLEEELIYVDVVSTSFGGMTQLDEQHFLLTGRGIASNHIYIWNWKSEKIESDLYIDDFGNNCFEAFHAIKKCGNHFLVFPYLCQQDAIYEINLKENALIKNNILSKCLEHEKNNCTRSIIKTLSIHSVDSHIIRFMSGNDFMWYEYDFEKDILREFSVVSDESDGFYDRAYGDLIKMRIAANSSVDENDVPISAMLRMRCEEDDKIKKKDDVGEKIYNSIS